MILRNLNIERQERPEDNVHLENLNVREDEIQGNDIPEAGARYVRDVHTRSVSLTGLSYLQQVPCYERIRINENEEIYKEIYILIR